MKLKVMTIVGTRPEIIRLSRVIEKLDKYCDHTLVHTGQNFDYELNEIFFTDLGIRKPDFFLEAAGVNAAESIGKVIISSDSVIEDIKPEAVLILGDTNSSLAAISAKRKKVPIFHMEAGNRCFDQRVPEEINRKIVDHISDINLTYSQIARDYLIKEGLPPDQVIKTGSPMKEILSYYKSDIEKSSILEDLNLKQDQYFIVSSHREENVDSSSRLETLISSLNELSEIYKYPIIFSTHPRTKKLIEKFNFTVDPLIKFMKPFGYFDYMKLQLKAKCVLSDSGTITEESSILNFPALNIRDSHERPEGFEEASVMMVGLDSSRILNALHILNDQPKGSQRLLSIVEDYKTEVVSDKVLRIILSYTEFINQRVWKKY